MNILPYLLELLQTQKEVGVTQLGTFYKKKSPGRFDKASQSFLPPSYTLQFTTEVKEDEALSNHISAKNSIATESATEAIIKFTEEIQHQLETGHEAELPDLGRLFYTEHGGLTFEPAAQVIYGSEFYGLPPLKESSTDHAPEISAEASAYQKPELTLPPNIENVELDEVKDDLKHTLGLHPADEDVHQAPTFIQQQHEEHPDRFGHTPESEASEDHTVQEVPESVRHQHEEHPKRFGHTPETETLAHEINADLAPGQKATPKTYIPLEEEAETQEPVTEAPVFIKAQHAEHPNRFGHDPIPEETQTEPASIWPKIMIAFVMLIVAFAIVYLIKPELFVQQTTVTPAPVVAQDTTITKTNDIQTKQDSIAKTDSILKANQVQPVKADTARKRNAPVKAVTPPPTQEVVPVPNENTTFDIIAASFKTEEKASEFVQQMKKYGVTAKIVKLPGRLKKVSIASFPTEEEARRQRPVLAKKVKIKALDIIQINNTQP